MATVKKSFVDDWKEQAQKLHAELKDESLQKAIEQKEAMEAQENEIKAKHKALQEIHKRNAELNGGF